MQKKNSFGLHTEYDNGQVDICTTFVITPSSQGICKQKETKELEFLNLGMKSIIYTFFKVLEPDYLITNLKFNFQNSIWDILF